MTPHHDEPIRTGEEQSWDLRTARRSHDVDALFDPPVTAGLIMSVLSRERLGEVMRYYERHRDMSPEAGSAWVLLGGLTYQELAAVALRVSVPLGGRFFDLLMRLRERCPWK